MQLLLVLNDLIEPFAYPIYINAQFHHHMLMRKSSFTSWYSWCRHLTFRHFGEPGGDPPSGRGNSTTNERPRPHNNVPAPLVCLALSLMRTRKHLRRGVGFNP